MFSCQDKAVAEELLVYLFGTNGIVPKETTSVLTSVILREQYIISLLSNTSNLLLIAPSMNSIDQVLSLNNQGHLVPLSKADLSHHTPSLQDQSLLRGPAVHTLVKSKDETYEAPIRADPNVALQTNKKTTMLFYLQMTSWPLLLTWILLTICTVVCEDIICKIIHPYVKLTF